VEPDLVLLIGFGTQIDCGLVGRFSDPSDLTLRLWSKPGSRRIVVSMKPRITELGGTVSASSPVDFAKLIADETEKWRQVIREANIRQD
jgi:hypothetical protein